jgi:hypothetical protein
MNTPNKLLIIVGSAPCVQEDIAVALASRHASRFTLHEIDFMLIGLDSVDKCLWPAKYFATYHPVDIIPAKERRAKAGGNTDWIVISQVANNGLLEPKTIIYDVDMVIPLIGRSGSSALLGIHAGIREGYLKIIVCGCPLTGKNDKGQSYSVFQKGWMAKHEEIKDNVRSMSGWTRELLGAPTEEWLSA